MAVSFTDSTGRAAQIAAASDSAAAQFQLLTQSQGDIVLSNDKAVIASGTIQGVNTFSSDEFPQIYDTMDMLPQMWSNGYLVATENIYLGASASTGWVAAEDLTCCVVLECTVETMTQAAAMALALSQQ